MKFYLSFLILFCSNILSAQEKLGGVFKSTTQVFIPTDKKYSVVTFSERKNGVCYNKLKAGLIDTNGNVLIPFQYKELTRLALQSKWVFANDFKQNSYLISIQDTLQRYNVLNSNNYDIHNQRFFQIEESNGQYSTFDIVKLRKVYGPLATPLRNVEPYGFMIAGNYSKKYESLRKTRSIWQSSDTNWYAYMDTNFVIKTPFVFKNIRFDSHKNSFVITNNSMKGLLDSTGKMLFDPSFDNFGLIWPSKNFIAVQFDGFEEIELRDQDGMAARRGGEYQIYKLDGTLMVKDTFKEVKSFNPDDSLFVVTRDGQTQMLDIPKDAELVPATPIYYVANAKKNLLSMENKYVLPYNVEDIHPLSKHNYLIETNREYSIYNYRTKKITSLKKYRYCSAEHEFIRASNKDSMYILNSSGLVLGQAKDYYNPYYYHQYCVISRGGFYGVVNSDNKTIIPFKYDSLVIELSRSDRNEGWYAIAGKRDKLGNQKLGIIDSSNKMILPFEYDEIKLNPNPRARFVVMKANKKGLLDIKGKQVLPLAFDEIEYVREDDTTILVRKDGKSMYYTIHGMIRKIGDYTFSNSGYSYQEIQASNGKVNILHADKKPLLKVDADQIQQYPYDGHLFKITTENKSYVINNQGYEIIEPDAKDLDGYMMFKKHDSLFYLNQEAESVWLGNYDRVSRSSTYFQTERNRKFGIMDFNYKVIFEPVYSSIYPKQNYFQVYKDSLYAYIDSNGNNLLPWSKNYYQEQPPFYFSNEKSGYLKLYDHSFKKIEIDSCVNFQLEMFHHQIAILTKKNHELVLLDLTGKRIYNETIFAFDVVRDSLYILKMKDKVFFTDGSAKRLSSTNYEDIQRFESNILKVKQNGLFGLVDTKMNQILACKYLKIEFKDYNAQKIKATDESNKVYLFNEKGEQIKE